MNWYGWFCSKNGYSVNGYNMTGSAGHVKLQAAMIEAGKVGKGRPCGGIK